MKTFGIWIHLKTLAEKECSHNLKVLVYKLKFKYSEKPKTIQNIFHIVFMLLSNVKNK